MHRRTLLTGAAAALAGGLAAPALAQDRALKVGLILPLTGPFAAYGQQMQAGFQQYLDTQSATAAGRRIEPVIADDGAIVGMVLHTPDGSAPDVVVNYRLSKGPQGYKVVDILVEGVSLLNTQRSEFASVVANKGLDYLIEALEKRGRNSQ